MFDVIINKQDYIISVTGHTVILTGFYAVDIPDRTLLVTFQQVEGTDAFDIHKILETISINLAKIYNCKIFYYFPKNTFALENKHLDLMVLNKMDIKYFDEKQYDLNAFWLKKCDENEMINRIESSTLTCMILDNIKNVPVAFGRLFTQMGYLTYISDILTAEEYQSKGLGSSIVNCLLKAVMNDTENKHGLICLLCADKGAGKISAPKLYCKFGFKFLKDDDKKSSLFLDAQHEHD
ncbi:unnamed protein product [Didymodactylos carnosus]|uniref:N-acetyltransferase domain-containing protein n=1 Tax=Didymodactylos carnosus TaxID=1234261 RepID=A0A815G0G0_9BILA|nr:unnamed protein product [Didymodactylos carnosus]CAF1333260.1 unnamed protein product [Didymodactylos carnosus]CAF4144664.1 unnamed protein product [Didymodactylos carnosus]CAF4187223.1 unnamed protein product [Didymodactylos carnosus]